MRDKWNDRADYRERTIARASEFIRAEVSQPDEWPDPQPLGAELPPVQNFNPNLLPASLRPMVEDVSERMQAPIDYAGTSAIVALAGCVNRRARIQPKVEDAEWLVVPNLWGVIIGPPGYMKSPMLRQVTLPLVRIEELWRAEFKTESEGFEYVKEQAELRHQAWREQYKAASKKGEAGPTEPDPSLTPPVQRRLIVSDATFERLHEILAENPAGVMVIRDELTGWLSDLEKHGRESERGFYLQSWNGDSGFTVDRIGRGTVHVPAVCVSLLANIQPARLRWYFAEMLRGGPADDGLFQRLQAMVWPDPPRTWELVDRAPNAQASATAEKTYRCLAGLSADFPVRLRFSVEAQEMFFGWWAELERKVRGESHLHPTLVAHLSKYRKLMPSVAGLFELADRAAASQSMDEPLIAPPQAERAVALCSYFESHAHRVYSCVITPELQAAHELCRHIKRGDVDARFTTRTIHRKCWAGLDSHERVEMVLELLEDANWVRRVPASPSTAGRPSEGWLLNPKLGKACPK